MTKSLPPETIIKFSKWKVLWFITMVLVVIACIISIIQGGSILKYIMSFIGVLIGTAIAYFEYWDLLIINKPQLIISTKGIQANDGTFYEWDIIKNEKIVPLGSVKPTYFLWFETPEGNRKLHLYNLNKLPDQIMELIRQYREMYTTLSHI